ASCYQRCEPSWPGAARTRPSRRERRREREGTIGHRGAANAADVRQSGGRMSAAAPAAPVVWAPEGTSRGTVVVLTGRGEHPGVYARLGRRLAFDGWTVAVPSDPADADTALD